MPRIRMVVKILSTRPLHDQESTETISQKMDIATALIVGQWKRITSAASTFASPARCVCVCVCFPHSE